MKIAVYTICKNESKFVKQWLESCVDADYLLIADTGSSDDTVKEIKKQQAKYPHLHTISLSIVPWRFDDARNVSLHSLPADIDVCVCLDMDEVLTEGWRAIIEANWESDTDILRYNYIWNWVNGEPGVTYFADKIHARHGFKWVNPVHEVLRKDFRLGTVKQKFIEHTLIEHYADNKKSRAQYLPLLELAVQEDPTNDRNMHYYARDLMYAGQYDKAIEYFAKHLELPTATWKSERAASMRYVGDCYWAKGDFDNAVKWFKKAVSEVPNEREAYVSLAQAYRYKQDWANVSKYCKQALSITERPNTYINQTYAWSDWPVQMLNEAEGNKK